MPRSKLLGVAPSTVEPGKTAVLIYGPPGVKKTWVSLDFPRPFYIDCEGGASLKAYQEKLEASGGCYMGLKEGSQDFATVLTQIHALATEEHPYRTVVIDSISKLWAIALSDEQEKLGTKDAFGAYKKGPTRQYMSMIKWIQRLDMNGIFIAQQKEQWGFNAQTRQREMLGYTYDGQEKLEHDLHLTLRIARPAEAAYAYTGKTRLAGFTTGEVFDWSYSEFAKRFGRDIMESASVPLSIANNDQLTELFRLIDVIKMPPDWEEKVFKKAGVDDWREMDGEHVDKCITMLKSRMEPV
jgi:AAA domain